MIKRATIVEPGDQTPDDRKHKALSTIAVYWGLPDVSLKPGAAVVCCPNQAGGTLGVDVVVFGFLDEKDAYEQGNRGDDDGVPQAIVNIACGGHHGKGYRG